MLESLLEWILCFIVCVWMETENEESEYKFDWWSWCKLVAYLQISICITRELDGGLRNICIIVMRGVE